MLKKLFVGLLLVAAAGLIYLNYGKLPPAIDHNDYSYHMLQPGPYRVSSHDRELVDPSRGTVANGDFPGAESRTLVTRIWLPEPAALETPQPLLVYSHGFMSSRIGGTHIAEHLASYGYVVAAPDFPLTHYSAPKPPRVQDVVNQPGDVSFVIDTLLLHSRTETDPLFGAIDEARIAVAGLSLGGMTTSLVAFHPDDRDPRIKAAISIAGPTFMFGPAFYREPAPAFMMIASPIDAMVDYEANAQPILDTIPGAVLVSIADASHTGFAYQAKTLRWFDNPDEIGCWAIKDKAETASETSWLTEIGTPEQGISLTEVPTLCERENLPTALNPIRQQWLATLAVSSFLQSLFAPDQGERLRQRQFLLEQLALEMPEVSVQSAVAPSP